MRSATYALQVSELEKIRRLEPEAPAAPRRALPLRGSEKPHGATCLVCGQPATGACPACQSVSYCSKQHQAEDARWHDVVCGSLEQARDDGAFRERVGVRGLVEAWIRDQTAASKGRGAAGEPPATWAEYLDAAPPAEPAARRLLTDVASRPLTLARLIHEFALLRERTAKDVFRVHVMGASDKELEAPELVCLCPPTRNPFRSLAWRRSSTIANDLCQDNTFLSVWAF